MLAFEKLCTLLAKQNGVYAAAEFTDHGVREETFLPSAGAHNCYSIAKSFTSCALGILEGEGKLRDTDRLFFYLEAPHDEKWDEVTLRDVCLHKTGTPAEANIDIDVEDFWAEGKTDFLQYVLSQPLLYEPGEGPFVYSDMNYYLLSRVVEQVTGRTTAAFLQEKLFNPLHFRGNAWGTCPQGHTLGGTGLFLRARDLAAYGYMLACGGVYESRRLLPQEWIEKAKGAPGTYGYGFFNTPDNSYFVAGGMYGQTLYVFPSTHSAVAIQGHGVQTEEVDHTIVPLYL